MIDFFLADDLSGALDAAAGFHHAGRRVRIVLSAETWSVEPDDDVIAVTTETRNAPPSRAAEVVRRAIEQGQAKGARLVYKKIDSTLRGPVAAEIGALAATLPKARILFAPANPRVGRTVRDGELLVRGVPVVETEFARDPVSPVRESVIRRLLGSAASERVIVPDTETEEDLVAAVTEIAAAGDPWVGVGSGALARPVAARVSAAMRRGAGRDSPAPPRGPCLMLCGSAHPGNREQAAVLARERGATVHELTLDSPARAVDATIASLGSGSGAAILVEARRGDSREVVRLLGNAAAQILAATSTRRVFVTGGETAFAVCDALSVNALTFCREVEAGLSVSRASHADGAVLFAIKPGGFGDVQTWVRAWDALVVI